MDEPLGIWDIGVQGVKSTEGGTVRAGWGTVSVRISPARIALSLLSPSGTDKVYFNSTLRLRFKASYPDGTPVSGAFGNLTVSGTRLAPKEVGEGTYQADYFVPDSSAGGTLSVSLSLSDQAGNSGSAGPLPLSVESIPEPVPVPPFYETYYEQVIRPYWQYIAAGALAAALVATPLLHRWRVRVTRMRLEGEVKDLKTMQKVAQMKYYSNMSISKRDFDALMKDYSMRLEKASERLAKLRRPK